MSGGKERSSGGKEMVEVQILGESYTIRSETSPEYTRRVAEHVDRTAREIRDEGGVVDAKKAAILTAFAVTDQLFRMREGVDVVKGLAEKRAERLTADLLAALEASGAD
ncbi:MAG: cell division protein ZapA [Gemmatimonadetes bacterium]|uniref:Cell division protein ZapA n=1 Tax=Candidatus Kutchimonas denitrificans TaxID=3056748 RepID=A0AAE4Z707_9BACT|nr:cell division protein ZapA [Gemmatimonadota bacterium]NIR74173.1 cell division protein ZapA [Candidatus Kutchimonas denitrificans]NIR99795.1 cell division protein ZapA [Gemmatimonadota bacterium]NIT65384.1 cell division protein ZapA [Gemmatimonadota bacterium]NIU51750.1 cell division protein ZapA [Gemmatimonadota bacterium]